ncbi:hypothetical protein E4U34_001346 [Claviceps purpurea]|nr:hypothetical protein E4U34_001346 [Claviceps purpurea]
MPRSFVPVQDVARSSLSKVEGDVIPEQVCKVRLAVHCRSGLHRTCPGGEGRPVSFLSSRGSTGTADTTGFPCIETGDSGNGSIPHASLEQINAPVSHSQDSEDSQGGKCGACSAKSPPVVEYVGGCAAMECLEKQPSQSHVPFPQAFLYGSMKGVWEVRRVCM